MNSLELLTPQDRFSQQKNRKSWQASEVNAWEEKHYLSKAPKKKSLAQQLNFKGYSGLNYLGKEYYFAWAESLFFIGQYFAYSPEEVENLFFIEQYFAYSPEERVKNSRFSARYVKTLNDVLFVLKCASSRDIREGFDGGVAILAECSEEILIKTIHWLRRLLIHSPEKAKIYENYWEILILAIACAKRLSEMRKFQLFLSLFVNNLGRAVKTSLIDGLRLLDYDPELIKICLERFLSPRERDDYIRAYAQEAIDDLS